MPNVNAAPSAELQAVIRYLAKLGRDKFFGHVHIAFHEGRIANVKQEQQFRPPELPKG